LVEALCEHRLKVTERRDAVEVRFSQLCSSSIDGTFHVEVAASIDAPSAEMLAFNQDLPIRELFKHLADLPLANARRRYAKHTLVRDET
jgi:hypothetical protein